ncbi:MAG: DegT/DnrJ/EryC1/StrS family aminotransferase [Lachnospiraceae bacterium]|nr:DegT/DnrJ/EryC1/StrS family aminotransferase [Lachnospiraceae bacterium]
MNRIDYQSDPRFSGIKPFEQKVWLASPTMHGEEQKYVDKAIRTNWVSTVGENIDEVERITAGIIGRNCAVALSSGTAALHLGIRLCGEKLYGQAKLGQGVLKGHKVFCSDLTFDATVNPVAYEGGEAIFIDTEYETWNMDPEALEKAFLLYPDVQLVVMAHLYGTPGKIEQIKKICDTHGALLVEDAAESFGATYQGVQTGVFGTVSAISFNGNKIITGSSGGMLLMDSQKDADRVRKWSTQSRENAAWYQHEELGFNYRMSNLIAGVVRGQLMHLEEHIAQKKMVYQEYRQRFQKLGLPVQMNPFDKLNSKPNHWLSCLLLEPDVICRQVRGERESLYISERGKSCPTEILEALAAFGAEGRPIWKPMHLQPIYRMNAFVTKDGSGRGRSNAYVAGESSGDVGADLFERGLCLPSDNKMTEEVIGQVVQIVERCFGRR